MSTETLTEVKTYREDYRRGHRYVLDGQIVPSVTHILGDGWPKQLAQWGASCAASKAVNEWAKLSRLPVAERLKVLTSAPWDSINRAGIQGSRVHKLAEKLVNGESVSVPEDIAGFVKAAQSFLTDWTPEVIKAEGVVMSRKYQYGGTFDLAARLKDGNIWGLDWKTNRSGPFGEVGMQLAAYFNADFMLDDNGSEVPVPRPDECGVIWLKPDGTYEFYPYETGRKVFRAFLAVKDVAVAVEDSKYWKGDALTPLVEL